MVVVAETEAVAVVETAALAGVTEALTAVSAAA